MLNSRQKSFLRSLAMTEKPIVQIGKDGISDSVINNINNVFRTHELIKVTVMKSVSDDIKEIAFDLARLTRSEMVQIIGRQVILYKAAKEPQIILP
ncbi:MAG: ribosome assembly RNA-binding protein YhbY [Solobacterium sp.]|nr:ribosome assembly RNA-binding protein YhbY [Solobacterium sp.]